MAAAVGVAVRVERMAATRRRHAPRAARVGGGDCGGARRAVPLPLLPHAARAGTDAQPRRSGALLLDLAGLVDLADTCRRPAGCMPRLFFPFTLCRVAAIASWRARRHSSACRLHFATSPRPLRLEPRRLPGRLDRALSRRGRSPRSRPGSRSRDSRRLAAGRVPLLRARACGTRASAWPRPCGAAGFALSFGPALPGYAPLYRWLPLLPGVVRGAARFGFLALVAVAVLAGFGVAALRARYGLGLARADRFRPFDGIPRFTSRSMTRRCGPWRSSRSFSRTPFFATRRTS